MEYLPCGDYTHVGYQLGMVQEVILHLHDNGTCLDGLALLLMKDEHDTFVLMLLCSYQGIWFLFYHHLPSSLIGGSVANTGDQKVIGFSVQLHQ
jgi:hypothetical protein